MTLTVVYLLREVSDFGNFSTDTGSTFAETTNLEGSRISEESTAVPYGANFLFSFCVSRIYRIFPHSHSEMCAYE